MLVRKQIHVWMAIVLLFGISPRTSSVCDGIGCWQYGTFCPKVLKMAKLAVGLRYPGWETEPLP